MLVASIIAQRIGRHDDYAPPQTLIIIPNSYLKSPNHGLSNVIASIRVNVRNDFSTMYKEIQALLRQYPADQVVISLPESPSKGFRQIFFVLQKLRIKFLIMTQHELEAAQHFPAYQEGQYHFIEFSTSRFTLMRRFVKRSAELVIAIMALMVLWPVFIVIGVIIWWDSRGPIILAQQRIGQYGRSFTMYKFRTMYAHFDQNRFDESLLNIIKNPDDPRVTRIGRILRRTSLDELPQLINVLIGNMSIIGPRPEMPQRIVHDYDWWQYQRLAIPQGMTGWWQVNGRADRPMHLHTQDDLYYIHHYSLWLDFKILLRTVVVVLRGKGAF